MADNLFHMTPGEYYRISYGHGSVYTLLCVEHKGDRRYQVETYTTDGFKKTMNGTVNISRLTYCQKITKSYAMTLTNPSTNEEALSLLTKEWII